MKRAEITRNAGVQDCIHHYKESVKAGNKHAEDCLYKIIGIVFEMADCVGDGIGEIRAYSTIVIFNFSN